ncbi:unnamed protein product, partial [Prorocentrum cordatum]
EGPLAKSGGVAGWRQGLSGVTVSTASGLQLLACSMYLQGALGPRGFNLDSFAAFGGTVLHQRPRFISVVGLATETFSTNGTDLAGCAFGLIVAKPPGLAALHAAPAGGRPLGAARTVVGDIALQAVGTEQLVAARSGRAGLEVVRRLRGQRMPLSTAQTAFLAPSPSLGRQLGACGKSQGWTLCETLQARNLGSGPASTRCGAHEGRVRAAGALRRARRLDPIHKAGPAASRVRGRTVTGNADGELHSGRLAACRSAGALPLSAERGRRMRCAELKRRRNRDPAALRAGHAVQMMAGLLQTGELPPMMMLMEQGLEAAATRHARADAPWKHYASPLDAEMLTRARIDWHFKSERCMVTDPGDELDLMHLGPQGLGLEAGPGARSASFRHDARKLSHDTCLLGACISNPHWTQAQRCDRGRWLPAPEPPQGRRTDAMEVRGVRRPADDKLNGKLHLEGSTLEPLFGALRCEGWAIAHCDGDDNLLAEVYGAVGRDRCPQRTAKDGEDVAAWMLATLARPAVGEVNVVCSRQAVLDGLLTEAQRRGNEHADRLAAMGAQTHAVDKLTVVHQAQAGFVQELGRWIWRAVILGQGVEAMGGEGLPAAAERRQARFADAERSQAAEEVMGEGPSAKRPRLESARSTGSSSAALSASAVAFSILGHALSYACAGEGEGTQELVACSKCGAYMTLGGRSGVKPRLKERCPGDKTDKGGRNQRSLWLRGLHPGGRRQEGSRAARHRAKGEGFPSLRSQGTVPEHAQERYLEWLGTAAVPAADSSATATSAGNAPAAAAEPQVAADPGGGPPDAAAAAGPAGDALEDRRMRRRVARRGGPSVSK